MDEKSVRFVPIDHGGGAIMVDPECGVEAVLCCCVLTKTSTSKPYKKGLSDYLLVCKISPIRKNEFNRTLLGFISYFGFWFWWQ